MSTELLERRFAGQLLGDQRAGGPVAVADRLLAVQAQDLRSARLAIRARTTGATRAAIDRCLDDGKLVIGWLNRGTLHLVRRRDYWWLHALTTPPLFTGNARRLLECGVPAAAADRGVAVIERALTADGPLTRDQLGARVAAAGIPTAGQALVHLLMLACLRGLCVRGPFAGSRHAYVLAEDWVGPRQPIARERALAQLARRYLAGHAPADDRDLAKWAGLPLRDARAGLVAIERELHRREDGLLELKGSWGEASARPCLLDQWDPVLVGWRSRAPLLIHYPTRDAAGTHFRPFAFVGGLAVATWGAADGRVTIGEPFAAITRADSRALSADAAAASRFLQGAEAVSRSRRVC